MLMFYSAMVFFSVFCNNLSSHDKHKLFSLHCSPLFTQNEYCFDIAGSEQGRGVRGKMGDIECLSIYRQSGEEKYLHTFLSEMETRLL
jgi:hypothetical protein